MNTITNILTVYNIADSETEILNERGRGRENFKIGEFIRKYNDDHPNTGDNYEYMYFILNTVKNYLSDAIFLTTASKFATTTDHLARFQSQAGWIRIKS